MREREERRDGEVENPKVQWIKLGLLKLLSPFSWKFFNLVLDLSRKPFAVQISCYLWCEFREGLTKQEVRPYDVKTQDIVNLESYIILQFMNLFVLQFPNVSLL